MRGVPSTTRTASAAASFPSGVPSPGGSSVQPKTNRTVAASAHLHVFFIVHFIFIKAAGRMKHPPCHFYAVLLDGHVMYASAFRD